MCLINSVNMFYVFYKNHLLLHLLIKYLLRALYMLSSALRQDSQNMSKTVCSQKASGRDRLIGHYHVGKYI